MGNGYKEMSYDRTELVTQFYFLYRKEVRGDDS